MESKAGSIVRNRREAFGFSVHDLAGISAISADRISEIESGQATLTREIAALAAALAIEPAKLRSGDEPDARRSVARFRAPMGVSTLSPHDSRLLARAAEAARVGAFLQAQLGRDSQIGKWRDVSGVSGSSEPWMQGYALGRIAAEKINPQHSPVLSMQSLLEDLGVHVAQIRFESTQIEAASLFEAGSCPMILLNDRVDRIHYGLARRAVLAHELCHLLHDGGQRNLLTSVSRLSDQSPAEQRANGFAPNFIAPDSLVVVSPAKDPKDIVLQIARKWGLSFEGAAWHAKNLKLLSAQDADHLANLPQKPRFELDFEHEIPRTPPDQFGVDAAPTPLIQGLISELAILASEEGLISSGRAAEILSLQ